MRFIALAPLLFALLLPCGVSAKPEKKPKATKALRTPAQTPGFGDPAHGGTPGRYAERPEVQAWMTRLAAETGLDATDLQDALEQARYQRRAAQLMMPAPAGVPKNWAAYRDRFIEPVRLQTGLRFWAQHADTLARAESQFGVPAALIMGILGVETNYGQIMGNYRVLDALATLAFDFPGQRSDRSPYFQGELGAFLQLAKAEGRSPTDFKGSFAGAMGYGQFMPSSWRQYAVDFDGDAHIDLIGNPVDAIGSVANFLRQHGWTPGMPTHVSVERPPASESARLLDRDIEPHWRLSQLQAAGQALPASAQETLAQHEPWAFVELENGPKAPENYLLGSKNFWVVTRYNRSAYYAMAVISLGERLEQLRRAGQ
jgi:membrane-bound lytic murein transglycosylase B